ncbi:M56 family metallopeptidase [Streptomyces sp. NPDC001691]|uniref:M56 family metallopeptidase n=1 Tax=Streptomyces sp. NPDC001691 TaxID=3364600 RepID=UPI00367AAA78
MGVFVVLPLVLPLTAWPIARLAGPRLHPRTATRVLALVGGVLAVCSTLCLLLLMVAGTAQLPGNPLPDAWADPEVRAVVPYDEAVGQAALVVLAAVVASCGQLLWRHWRVRAGATRALNGLTRDHRAVVPDERPYAYALPGGPRGRVVVSSAMLELLDARERQALIAHEEAHLTGRHHRYLLVAGLAARANPFLRPLRFAVAFTAERWADEDAARAVGDRRVVARAIGKAALASTPDRRLPLPAFAAAGPAPGPVPRRVAALLRPVPPSRAWPPAGTAAGLALWTATAGAAASALSSANATLVLVTVLRGATEAL